MEPEDTQRVRFSYKKLQKNCMKSNKTHGYLGYPVGCRGAGYSKLRGATFVNTALSVAVPL